MFSQSDATISRDRNLNFKLSETNYVQRLDNQKKKETAGNFQTGQTGWRWWKLSSCHEEDQQSGESREEIIKNSNSGNEKIKHSPVFFFKFLNFHNSSLLETRNYIRQDKRYFMFNRHNSGERAEICSR